MIRIIIAVLIALWIASCTGLVHAQTVPKHNCSTVACTWVTDPLPAAATQCRLYGVKDGGAQATYVTSGVVGGQAVDPTYPASSRACWLVQKLPVGHWDMTATWIDAANNESPQSAAYTFDNTIPIPGSPSNLRPKLGTPAF